MKIKSRQRLNPTRPVVEGVHINRYDPEFINWFDEHRGEFADWFVNRVKRGDMNDCKSANISGISR